MQEILKGIENIEKAVEGSKKVLLVCDSSFQFLNIKEDIENMSVPYVKFDQFTPNPLYEDVCKGVDVFNITKCDTILAVGGGSSMDVAKCIKLFCKMPNDKIYLDQEYKETGIKLIAIPTTAGTGSESTRYAVIYYDGKKQSVTHDSIIPNVAILEPEVLKTLPLYQKKCTMLDALCQGIESWWSVNSTDESKEYSKIAVETIMKWWREYIFENTKESAVHIMEAANFAGRAISITQTTAPHAFSYKVTSLYGLPHGHAVAICMAEIWKYMLEHLDNCIDDRGINYLISIFKEIGLILGCELSYKHEYQCLREILKEMGMKSPISKDKKTEIGQLFDSVNNARLRNNPIFLDKDAIKGLYELIIQ